MDRPEIVYTPAATFGTEGSGHSAKRRTGPVSRAARRSSGMFGSAMILIRLIQDDVVGSPLSGLPASSSSSSEMPSDSKMPTTSIAAS